MENLASKARIAGALYLLITLTGLFNLMYVPSRLFMHGNVAATVQNLQQHEGLFRINLWVGLGSSVCFLFLALALRRMFKDVDAGLSWLMVILVLIQVPMTFMDALIQAGALEMARGEIVGTAFGTAQREALTMLFLRLDTWATYASELFWGLWLFPLAGLILKSRRLPKVLGIWLLLNGVAYLVLWSVGLLAPGRYDAANRMAFPLLLGEMAFMLWLLVFGAREPAQA